MIMLKKFPQNDLTFILNFLVSIMVIIVNHVYVF